MNGSNFEQSRFQINMLSYVIEVLRWLFKPSYHTPPPVSHVMLFAWEIEMAEIQNGSKSQSRFCWDGSLFQAKKPRWLKIRSIQFPEFNFFRILSHLSKKTRDRYFQPFWNWAISNSHAYDFTWEMSPAMTFWAISPYPCTSKRPWPRANSTIFWISCAACRSGIIWFR